MRYLLLYYMYTIFFYTPIDPVNIKRRKISETDNQA